MISFDQQHFNLFCVKAHLLPMTAYALLFIMASLGLAETSYLIRLRRQGERPVCPMGGNCHAVLESKWAKMFGVHNDILGFIFYVITGTISAFLVLGFQPFDFWVLIVRMMIAGAVVMSASLTLLQGLVIKSWCFWCLMSATTVGVMALIAIIDLA